MASSYSILNAFNNRSTKAADRTRTARFPTRDISIYDIYSSDRNFYPQDGIEQKAAEILSVGLLSSLAVSASPSDSGVPYKLISGERRWRALCLLVERGYEEFETVTCQIRNPANEHEELVELIIANSAREKDVVLQLREAQTLKRELQYMKENNLKLNGYDLQSGKLRDVVADMMNLSKTKVAELDAVANHLIVDFMKLLESKLITFSAAYQLSKLDVDCQNELFEQYQTAGELSCKDVVAFAKQNAEEQEEQLPGQMVIDDFTEIVPVTEDAPEEEEEPCAQPLNECEKLTGEVQREVVEPVFGDAGMQKCHAEELQQNENVEVIPEEAKCEMTQDKDADVGEEIPDKDAVELTDATEEFDDREKGTPEQRLESKEYKIAILDELIEEKRKTLSMYDDSMKADDAEGIIHHMEQKDSVALLAFYSYRNFLKYGYRILEKKD